MVSDVDHATFTQADIESNDVRCPDSEAAKEMYKGPSLPPSLGASLVSCWLPAVMLSVCVAMSPNNVWAFCAVIDEVRKRGDSCGGEVTCVIRACPKGLGSPVFDKLEAELAKAFMSLPASKASLLSL